MLNESTMSIKIAEAAAAVSAADPPTPSVRDAQTCRDKVSPGRNGFSGQTGEVISHTCQLISVLMPAV